MRDQNGRSFERPSGEPRFQGVQQRISVCRPAKEGIERRQVGDRAEFQQCCGLTASAPLAGVNIGAVDAIGPKARADATSLVATCFGKIALRTAVSVREVRRVARARCDRVPHQRDMAAGPQRFPERGVDSHRMRRPGDSADGDGERENPGAKTFQCGSGIDHRTLLLPIGWLDTVCRTGRMPVYPPNSARIASLCAPSAGTGRNAGVWPPMRTGGAAMSIGPLAVATVARRSCGWSAKSATVLTAP